MDIKNEVNNDYFALSEAINRRIKNLQKSKSTLPEVILIDGGKGQLSTVFNNLDNNIQSKILFISISKGPNRKEKYDFLHFDNKKYELKKFKDISKVLQLLRNESHRFAISQHRKRRSKNFLSSSLDEINGVGHKIHSNLLRHFGSKEKIEEASLDELKSVDGIGNIKAQEIQLALNKK
jgi:excinuclease ABC subunit C